MVFFWGFKVMPKGQGHFLNFLMFTFFFLHIMCLWLCILKISVIILTQKLTLFSYTFQTCLSIYIH